MVGIPPSNSVKLMTTDDRPAVMRLLHTRCERWRADPQTPQRFRAKTTTVDGLEITWQVMGGSYVCCGQVDGVDKYRATIDDLRPYVGRPI